MFLGESARFAFRAADVTFDSVGSAGYSFVTKRCVCFLLPPAVIDVWNMYKMISYRFVVHSRNV
jgi:hypothetical protein